MLVAWDTRDGDEILTGLKITLGTAVFPCGAVAKFSTGHREARGSILRRAMIFSLSPFIVGLLASASSWILKYQKS